jgi:alanyl-tRNA synthetase
MRDYKMVAADASAMLKVPESELSGRIESLMKEADQLKKKVRKMQSGDISGRIDSIIDQARRVGDIVIATGRIDVDSVSALRHQADKFRNKVDSGIAVLSRAPGEKLEFVVSVTDSLIERGIDANMLVKILRKISGGGGGGKKHLAQLGTRDTGSEKAVFDSVPEIVKDMI